MEWDFKNGLPIYSQIIDAMISRIASGIYDPGEKLPSVRELAVDAGVNPNTMQRALAELESMGLLYTERTSGRFVTKDRQILDDLREKLILRYFEDFRRELGGLGMSDEDIKSFVNKQFGQDQPEDTGKEGNEDR